MFKLIAKIVKGCFRYYRMYDFGNLNDTVSIAIRLKEAFDDNEKILKTSKDVKSMLYMEFTHAITMCRDYEGIVNTDKLWFEIKIKNNIFIVNFTPNTTGYDLEIINVRVL